MMLEPHSVDPLQAMYEVIKQLSLYELHRLKSVLWNEIEDPARLRDAKNRFKEGDRLEWFSGTTNKTHFAKVLDKKRKYVLIVNEDDGRTWNVPYYVFNLSQQSVEFAMDASQKLTKQHCSVGDNVGFSHEGRTYYGEIIRLNPKTASVDTTCGGKWRVSYRNLVTVIDSESQKDALLIEGEIE